MEQGIFSRGTGNFLNGSGNSCVEQGIASRRSVLANNLRGNRPAAGSDDGSGACRKFCVGLGAHREDSAVKQRFLRGTPRRHRHHGYDSIAADEAAVTGYQLEELRNLLHEESTRREHQRRERRPIRYLYQCPNCGKEYPRARRYSQAVSCSACDSRYNPQFRLLLRG